MTRRFITVLAFVAGVAATTTGCGTDMEYEQSSAALRVCADGPTLTGIDVSHWQGTIDWDRVAGDGVTFAFIRVSDGLGTLDRKFDRNWSEAKRVGIYRGAYQFFRPNQDPIAQADLFLNRLGWQAETGDLPPVLDIEVSGGLSARRVASRMRRWLDRVESVMGVKPIIYASPGLWNSLVASDDFGEYVLWVAHYGTSCPRMPWGWSRWDFHQYSDRGRVAGIASSHVDMDRFNGSLSDLEGILIGDPVCGDGRCNGDETPDTCSEDCHGCRSIPALGRIVDETDSCFEVGGPSQYWRSESAGYDDSLLWTHATATRFYNYGIWHLNMAMAGKYVVEAYTDAAFAQSRQARYQVHHDGQTDVVVVDQTAVDGWNLIGEFDFAEGGDQWIRLEDKTGESSADDVQVVFDAVRLTMVPPDTASGDVNLDEDMAAGQSGGGRMVPDPEDEPSHVGTAVGCATAKGADSDGLLWIAMTLFGLAVVRRRRRGKEGRTG